jgi:phenylalanine-4-hydroxylase
VGAGLLSSCGELERFRDEARLVPFVAEEVVETDYDPTRYQETLFVLPGSEALRAVVAKALRELC